MKLLSILALMSTVALAADTKFEAADSVVAFLKRQTGQKVEVRLKSGDKLSGKLEVVGDKAAHLSALTGQEFYEAVVSLDDISAVIIRSSGK